MQWEGAARPPPDPALVELEELLFAFEAGSAL